MVLKWLVALAFPIGFQCVEAAATPSLGNMLASNIWKQDPLPLTAIDALRAGWSLVNNNSNQCDQFFGQRYRLGHRLTPTIMYDKLGQLAGLETAVNTDSFPLFPDSNLASPPFHLDPHNGSNYALSIHFTDPQKICSDDHKKPVANNSIGDRFWIRHRISSSENESFDVIPLSEADLLAGMPANSWTAGGCAPTGFAGPQSPGMGTHYWKGLTQDRNCTTVGPIFLLYNHGALHAFGLVFVGADKHVPTVGGKLPFRPPCPAPCIQQFPLQMNGKSLWEFPTQPLHPFFFHEDQSPSCLGQNLNTFNTTLKGGGITLSTMHFFFSDPFDMTCGSDPSTPTTLLPSTTIPSTAAPSARTTDAPVTPPPVPAKSSGGSGLSGGMIALVVCVVLVAMAGAGVVSVWWCRLRRAGSGGQQDGYTGLIDGSALVNS